MIYGLLVSGSVLFSLPFLWMVTTSVKVDRELFQSGLNLFPQLPNPRIKSPYVDASGSVGEDDLPDPARLKALAEVLGTRAEAIVPDDLEHTDWQTELAKAACTKLRQVLPEDVWEAPEPEFVARSLDALGDRMITDLWERIEHRFCFGQLRVRSNTLVEQELGEGKPYDQRFQNRTPSVATLSESSHKTVRFASVNYDFHGGDRVVLSDTYAVQFEPANLQRVQLYLKPDDTWHTLLLTLEAAGVRYRAERIFPMANDSWTMVTWQKPGPDDSSTKLKTWILLREDRDATGIFNEPNKIKITLELRQSSFMDACWSKLAQNYIRVLDFIPFWRYVRVSIFLVLVNVILTVFACSLVAYAFARLNWPGRDFCFLLMLATLMIPGQVTMIPHFLIWKALGTYNSLTPLWLAHAFGNAFFIFLLRQFLKGIPRDLEDAAKIDGCGTLRIYWHLMLPLMKPSLAAIAIFTFMGTWNDFMGPLVYIADQRLYPLAFGLYAFSVQVGNNPALTMAGSLLMTLPVIIIFFFAQKYFIQGVTLTGMKG